MSKIGEIPTEVDKTTSTSEPQSLSSQAGKTLTRRSFLN